jgi:replication factor A1
MRNRASPAEYLALLSAKYGVDVDEFFNALISARNTRKSSCGVLSIECRSRRKNRLVLLITKGQKVVAQFPIPEEFFLLQNNPIKDAQRIYMLDRYSKKDRKPRLLHVKDLRNGMKGVNIKAEVLEVAEPKSVVTRFGSYASLTNAIISDETGKIKLCLWNEQVTSLSVGDTVQIENARISAFKGEIQVRIGKNSVLRVAEENSS